MRLWFLVVFGWLASHAAATKLIAADSMNAMNIADAATIPAPAAGTPAGDAGDPRSEGRSDCRFERPPIWPGGPVAWLGTCRGGFADGTGVIVSAGDGGAAPERFYGRVRQGRLSVGVLQTPGGFLAGTWAHGSLVDALADDVAQRNAVIAAFNVAANAASVVSRSLAKKADLEASRFYARQAKLLRAQMD